MSAFEIFQIAYGLFYVGFMLMFGAAVLFDDNPGDPDAPDGML